MTQQNEKQQGRRAILSKYGVTAAAVEETAELAVALSYHKAWRDATTEWLALSMPLPQSEVPMISAYLPPFLDGLIPEGWLLEIASRAKPSLAKDRFGLLMATCGDAVGAVGVTVPQTRTQALAHPQEELFLKQEPFRGAQLENPYGRCLICAEAIDGRAHHYHEACAMELFGRGHASLPFFQEDFEALALENIRAQLIVPGAQRKISASLLAEERNKARITIFGAGEAGMFILKPEHPQVTTFPVNEHAAMMMARAVGLTTAAFGLMLGPDGKLSYVTRRFDRLTRGDGPVEKLAMEDFGQLFGRVRDHDKYKESFDKIGKYLRAGSPQAIIDCARFFDQVFFSYLIGNNDFHLRNVSVFTKGNRPVLTPAYDITITQLIDPEPDEDTTLPVNGKKRKLRRSDWIEFGMRMGMPEKAVRTRLAHFVHTMPALVEAAQRSFLPEEQKMALLTYVAGRMARATTETPLVAIGLPAKNYEGLPGAETAEQNLASSNQKKQE